MDISKFGPPQSRNPIRITRKMKKIVNSIRHRLPVKKTKVPRVAFTVLGHGLEKPEYKVVPKGCILIVPTVAGAGIKKLEAIQNNLALMQMENRNFVLDPLSYKKEIYSMFGPVTIFTEGDLYPNFKYVPFGFYPSQVVLTKSGKKVKISSFFSQSGVIRIRGQKPVNTLLIDTLKSDESFLTGKNKHLQDIPGIVKIRIMTDEEFDTPLYLVDGELPDISTYSELTDTEIEKRLKGHTITMNPAVEAIFSRLNLPELLKFSKGGGFNSDWLAKIIAEQIEFFKTVVPNDSWIYLTVGTYLDEILSDMFVITQEELFEKEGRGVYYNFVCRKITQDNAPVNPFKLGVAELHRIYEAEKRKVFLRNVFSEGSKRMSGDWTHH